MRFKRFSVDTKTAKFFQSHLSLVKLLEQETQLEALQAVLLDYNAAIKLTKPRIARLELSDLGDCSGAWRSEWLRRGQADLQWNKS